MRLVSKGMLSLVALALTVGSMAGCATQNQDQGRPGEGQNNVVRRETAPINYQRDELNRRRTDRNIGMNQERARNPRRMGTDRTQSGQLVRVADNVADSVARLKSVDTATVLVTDKTAYVAVKFDKDYRGGVTNRMKEQVTRRVKQTDPSIDRVYVSANPDFISRMGDFANDVRDGRPISGIMDQFREVINRTFPNVK